MIKKGAFLRLSLLFLILLLALPIAAVGCTDSQATSDSPADDGIQIVTSFLPIYIFTANLVQGIDGIVLENMAAPDVGCLHDYQLLPADMIRVEAADIFIFNGAGMESFLTEIAAGREDLAMIEASSGLDLLQMPDGTDNAHVWLSVRLAIRQVQNISAGLQRADPAHQAIYAANESAYVSKLQALDDEFRSKIADLPQKQIITFHEAFPYMADEYGLEVAAVIEREPGSEPSAADLAATIDLIRDRGIKALFAEPQYSAKVAETIAAETGAVIYTLDPIVTGAADAGTYEQKMTQNLAVLLEALAG